MVVHALAPAPKMDRVYTTGLHEDVVRFCKWVIRTLNNNKEK